MVKDGKILVGSTEDGREVFLLPEKANRHGLIAGATGTGKTVTLKSLAEGFSELGVPVFMADVKGDIAGIDGPTTYWELLGERGVPVRTTITEMGPLLLGRILNLNDLQSDVLTIVYKIADDNNLALIDTKDLKAMLNYLGENNKEFAANYGNISKQTIGAIQRAIVSLEIAGGDKFFGEPALDIRDWFSQENGKGMIHILDSQTLINDGRLYSTFLLWMLSELFETLPEVGDLDKPKMVFFFDEAHLLFKDSPKALLDKIEQVVKLIRSKGVGVYFITQNPRDIPDGVLAQLGNKIQHALHAYTPADQKALKAAAESFRINPAFDTGETIEKLGTGQAVVSMVDGDGTPTVSEKVMISPCKNLKGGIDDATRAAAIKASLSYSKYATAVDPESAYELIERMGQQKEADEAAALAQKEAAKAQAKQEALEQKEAEKEARKKTRAAQSVGKTVAGTVGREVGKQLGGNFGKFGKTLGGNVGAQLARGILSTLFKG
ncbi:MAG: DUF853 domain-containing protein [Pseudobutyrivibrio sp.]|nr:DUF853 domain-containing protein [Pseudobutyrivibrio sp.]